MTAARGPELAVGAIVLDGGRLLMVRRARDPGRGLWSVPGGRVERRERLADALVREVAEETGVEIEVGELAGFFEVIGDDTHYVVLDFLAKPRGGRPTPGGDVDAVEWVPVGDIASRPLTPRFVELLTAWGVLPARELGGTGG